MSIFEMSINDFKNVKRRESWCSPVPEFYSLVICFFLGHIWQRVPYAQYGRDGKCYCRCLRCGRLIRR